LYQIVNTELHEFSRLLDALGLRVLWRRCGSDRGFCKVPNAEYLVLVHGFLYRQHIIKKQLEMIRCAKNGPLHIARCSSDGWESNFDLVSSLVSGECSRLPALFFVCVRTFNCWYSRWNRGACLRMVFIPSFPFSVV